MKKHCSLIVIALLALVLIPVTGYSGDYQKAAVTHSSGFEKMKALVGVWEGKSDMGKGPETIRATYELTSSGNAVIERLFVGHPQEMVTVYYDFGGKLNMTHYCSLGNQPHMELINQGDNSLTFVLSKKNPNLTSLKETHMHMLNIKISDKDNIINTWTLYEKGKKKSDVVIPLIRVKS
ncbi:MAG TPA: hypothetical protein VK452_07185 [Dissulfurispiraceae bacterium]|nr:hypothetical protein [Dissulfurispiraceae bacterium]